jgi:hypothetical protein
MSVPEHAGEPRVVRVQAIMETVFTIRIPLDDGVPDPPAFLCGVFVNEYLKGFSAHDMTVEREEVMEWHYCDEPNGAA